MGQPYNFISDISNSYATFNALPPWQQDSLVEVMISRNKEMPENWRSFPYRFKYVSASEKGHYGEALEALFQAYDIDKKDGNNEAILSDLSNLLAHFLEHRNLERAAIYVEEIENLLENSELVTLRQDVLINLAGYYRLQGEHDKALRTYRRILRYSKNTGNDGLTSSALQNITGLFLSEKKLMDSAVHYAFLAAGLPDSNLTKYANFTRYVMLSMTYLEAEQYDMAQKYLEKASFYKKDLSSIAPQPLLEYHQYWIQVYLNSDNYQKAIYHVNRADSIEKLINDTSKYRVRRSMEEDFNVDYLKMRAENMKLRLEQAHRQRNYSLLGILLFAVILAVMFILFYQRRKLNAQRLKTLEEQVKRQKREEEIKIYESELRGREKEQERIGQDLHDRLGGIISASKLHAQNISETDEQVTKVVELLDEAGKEVKRISKDLITPIHEDPMTTAVRRIAGRFGKNGMKAHLNFYGLDEPLPQPILKSTLSIISELITNSHEHSGGENYYLTITRHQEHLNLIYEDDGKGLPQGIMDSSKGSGLKGIKRRVENLKGTVYLESTAGSRGVNMVINIPIDA